MQTVFTKRVLSATSSRSPTRVFSSFNPLEKVTQNNTKSVQNVQQNSIKKIQILSKKMNFSILSTKRLP